MTRTKIHPKLTDKTRKAVKKLIKDMGGFAALTNYMRDFYPYIMPQSLNTWIKYGKIPHEYILFLYAKSEGDIKPWDLSPHMYPQSIFENAPVPTVKEVLKMYKGKLYHPELS